MTLNPPNSVGNGLPLGLPGAVSATRYVGATASGAPASGTFQAGDFVVAQDGSLYICTAAGSPGTWVAVSGGGGGGELDYVEYTGNVSITATTPAAANTVVTSSAVVYDGATAVVIEFFTIQAQTGGSAQLGFVLFEGSTELGILGFYDANSQSVPVLLRRRLTPAAGSKTYSMRAYRGTADGTVHAGAGGASAAMPGYLRITRA